MSVASRIESLVQLGDWLTKRDDEIIDHAVRAASFENPWFTPPNVHAALDALCSYLDRTRLQSFMNNYKGLDNLDVKSIGLILAGNIPMVGFHDLLCVYLSGHHAQVKFSERDQVMMTLLVDKLSDFSSMSDSFQLVARIKDFDAVIATGGNTSANTFRNYFGQYPHIIRSNRNAVAVLTGKESSAQLEALGKDVFQYFGLGCRSVSKLYVPSNYNFEPLMTAFKKFESVMLHNKYKNNYDYNFATLEINRIPYMSNDSILLKEDNTLTSRIATLHYEHYEDAKKLKDQLENRSEEIQCIVGDLELESFEIMPFGKSQRPQLHQFADGIDTMKFLCEL